MEDVFSHPVSFFIFVFVIFLLRYMIIAGIAWGVFYVWKKAKFVGGKIQIKFPSKHDYWREIGYSLLTTSIFALVASLLFYPKINTYPLIYKDFSAHSMLYFIFSNAIILIIHDTYFYWALRFMHLQVVYNLFHKIHHKSTNPTPWAAFSFHPLEAFVEAGIIVIVVFILPLHRYALMTFILVMLVYNVYGHLGYELYSTRFRKSRFGRWLNTWLYHNYHHQYIKANYGLYFTFWDRWMGTLEEIENP